MKHCILLAALLLSLNSLCQPYHRPAFVGKYTDLLIGKRLIATPKDPAFQRFGYKGFFQEYDSTARFILPRALIYDSLVGDTFIVQRVNKVPYNANELNYGKYNVLILQSANWGLIYYLYDTENDFNMELYSVDDLTPPVGYYCGEVQKSKDKFTDEISWSTPLLPLVYFRRVKSASGDLYYMSLRTLHADVHGGKGVVILLENGSKIQKPNADVSISVNPEAHYYAISTFRITEADRHKLTTSAITDIRLYIYDQAISEGNRFKDLLTCLQKAE
ncbi:MAG: hypothetical protein JSS77_16195 [Acidobacteria bacterium]|nr:hypothetical protein [Acidobacteriota bacterium]